MKKSIKWKITFIFAFVLICCICSILLFNSLLLEKIYIKEKVNILKKSYSTISSGIIESYKNGETLSSLFTKKRGNKNNQDSNFIVFLRELQENYNVVVVLMDKDNNSYSLFQDNVRFGKRIMSYIFSNRFENENLQVLEKNQNYTISIYESKNMPPVPNTQNKKTPSSTNTKKTLFQNRNADIECFGMLSDNETAFFMTIPVASLKEPIVLFNKVLIIISIFIILFGSLIVYLISNKITLPLHNLSLLSKKMSNLEFENRYVGNSNDEIEDLGNSMNELSTKLEKAIADLKNANLKLQQDLDKKEKLDMLRQEFVANVSHELKTPITLIKGYAEGLENSNVNNNTESKEFYINVIKDEASKMNEIVHELLDLSHIESGNDELNFERINLFEIVNGVLSSLSISINEKNIKTNVDIDNNIYVWADGYKLEMVIRNYITNAIHYVDDNKIISITSSINGEYIRLNVFNSGIILSETDRLKVFEKFYKVDKARSREYGGTGLGLSIVKAISEKFNTGCGCFDSSFNNINGMTFYFDLSLK